jgi:hypothetical protein
MALKRSTIAAPAPITLVASGIAGFRTKSPDDKWVLGYSMIDTSADLSDLYLASATTAGTPTTLTTMFTAGLFSSDGFTADSSHAIYYTDIDTTGVGNFFTAATSGGAPVPLGTNVWLHYAGTGAKVVFNDNYNGTDFTTDIRLADTSQAAAPTVLVTPADADLHCGVEGQSGLRVEVFPARCPPVGHGDPHAGPARRYGSSELRSGGGALR